jgi:hypothetical protein
MTMLWFSRHRRLREQLSVYIDGELDSAAAERLEVHVEECERCRKELEQLRATATALRDLPEAEVPRSFVLTPQRVAAPRRVAPVPARLTFGMRIAAAGVAAALAAVLVVDFGDFGANGGTDDAPDGAFMTQTQMADREMEGLEEARSADGATDAAGGAAAPSEPKADDPDMGLSLPGVDGTPTAGDVGATAGSDTGDVAETPAAPPEESENLYRAETPDAEPGEAQAPADARDEGQVAADAPDGVGIDALTAAEIALAAALGVLVASSLVLAFAGRKR